MCRCKVCGKRPNEIEEYIEGAGYADCTPEEYVVDYEGTYNDYTGLFYCTSCYVKIGMPNGIA